MFLAAVVVAVVFNFRQKQPELMNGQMNLRLLAKKQNKIADRPKSHVS